jgi:hypothetical protein
MVVANAAERRRIVVLLGSMFDEDIAADIARRIVSVQPEGGIRQTLAGIDHSDVLVDNLDWLIAQWLGDIPRMATWTGGLEVRK